LSDAIREVETKEKNKPKKKQSQNKNQNILINIFPPVIEIIGITAHFKFLYFLI